MSARRIATAAAAIAVVASCATTEPIDPDYYGADKRLAWEPVTVSFTSCKDCRFYAVTMPANPNRVFVRAGAAVTAGSDFGEALTLGIARQHDQVGPFEKALQAYLTAKGRECEVRRAQDARRELWHAYEFWVDCRASAG